MRCKFVSICLILVFTSCSTVNSSLHYTKGTEALEVENYDSAIIHLEKAIELDPSLSRNHNNLAHAYFEKDRILDGWPHIRKAVILDPSNQYAHQNFERYFRTLLERGYAKEGYTQATIIENLGFPDNTLVRGEETLWQYGMVAIYFKEGKVTGFNYMKQR